MKKFKVTVTRTDEYEIEIDDKILDEKWMKDFRDVFYDFNTYEEHAELIAQNRARFGESFIEGYGIPFVNHKKPCYIEEEEVNEAININVISEDEDCEVDIEDIE